MIEAEGLVVASEQAPQGVEMRALQIKVVVQPPEPPPLELHRPEIRAGTATILDHAAVALRHPRKRAYFAITAAAVAGYRAALEEMRFIEIHTPKIVSSATETGANLFPLRYFDRDAFLAQSPQFYKQIMVGVFERVFEVGPVFRAEPHDTTRHLSQYVSLDAEIGFIEDHHSVMDLLRKAIAGMGAAVSQRCPEAVEMLRLTIPTTPTEIPHVHFSDAQELLTQSLGEDVTGEPDLAPAHERWLSKWALEKWGSDFLFVTGFPMVKRPFYTFPDDARPRYSKSFDLLFRGLEISTGGQRLHLYDDYVRVLGDLGQDLGNYEGYLEAFRYGMPPHGGFAIGLERWVARLVEEDNVRQTTLFPRDVHRLTP